LATVCPAVYSVCASEDCLSPARRAVHTAWSPTVAACHCRAHPSAADPQSAAVVAVHSARPPLIAALPACPDRPLVNSRNVPNSVTAQSVIARTHTHHLSSRCRHVQFTVVLAGRDGRRRCASQKAGDQRQEQRAAVHWAIK
jgi:hypothetical protein